MLVTEEMTESGRNVLEVSPSPAQMHNTCNLDATRCLMVTTVLLPLKEYFGIDMGTERCITPR